jgi:26S proteasome regulatory subunit N5
MAKTEKISFILEQVRLCLDKKDYVRSASLPMTQPPARYTVALCMSVILK